MPPCPLQVAETATQIFITNDRPNVAGIIMAGSADFKTELSQSDLFDQRLQAAVIGVVDVSYGVCGVGACWCAVRRPWLTRAVGLLCAPGGDTPVCVHRAEHGGTCRGLWGPVTTRCVLLRPGPMVHA